MRYIALLMLVFALSACGSTTTTHHATVARTTAPPSAAPSASALAPPQPLTCGTVVDTDTVFNAPSTTAETVIALLTAVVATDGRNILAGSPSSTSGNVLFGAWGAPG